MSLPVHEDSVPSPPGDTPARRFPHLLFCCGLIGMIWAVYWQVAGHQFVIYDDRTYVSENSRVLQGLTWENLRWAVTTFHDANWFPLTWLSHMLDVQLFGRNPTGHHLVNVGIHSLNAVLCYLVLARMTGNPWRSAVVAVIFALHPLRVESVAWVAERKDVLSALFWFLTMGLYTRYAARRDFLSYWWVLFFFVCGLLAKPMLVTLPFLLLLLDYWPLRRITGLSPAAVSESAFPGVTVIRAIGEKVPLLLLAIASSVVTFIAQRRGGTVSSFDHETTLANVTNALHSYLIYLWQFVWPAKLAVFYPFTADGLTGKALVAVPILLAVTLLLLWQRSERPYLMVGWFWYLGTMVPVIGFVKVGAHAYADRYTYIPLIGVTVMLVWVVAELTLHWRRRVPYLAGATMLIAVSCALLTYQQLGHWQNSSTLFTHTLAVTENNWLAHNNLSTELIRWGRFEEADWHISEALRIRDDYASAYINRGIIQKARQQPELAIASFQKALEFEPKAIGGIFSLGEVLLLGRGDIRGAYEQYQQLLALDPQQADALLGMIRFAESKRSANK